MYVYVCLRKGFVKGRRAYQPIRIILVLIKWQSTRNFYSNISLNISEVEINPAQLFYKKEIRLFQKNDGNVSLKALLISNYTYSYPSSRL